MKLTQIIRLLQLANTYEERKDILRANDTQSLRFLLRCVYDPTYLFGVKDFELSTFGTNILDDNLSLLQPLLNGEITGKASIKHLEELSTQLTEDDAKLLQMVIRKNLQCDLGVQTINKVYKNFIFKPPYMRCGLLNDDTKKGLKFPLYAQVKMDGMFAYLIVNTTDNKVSIMSRNGTRYSFRDRDMSELINKVKEVYNQPMVLMGELLTANENGYNPRQISNGIINKMSVSNNSASDTEIESVRYIVWDAVNLGVFDNRDEYLVPYSERFEEIKKLEYSFIKVVENRMCNSFDEVDEYYREVISRGEEGLVVKDGRVTFKAHTSKLQLKVKKEFEVELKVVGFEYGKKGTANEHTLGALNCESACGKLKVSVGTGFTEKQRKEITDNFTEYMDKVVTIKAHQVLSKDGKTSLFLPVFIEFRADKDIADNLDTIYDIEKASI